VADLRKANEPGRIDEDFVNRLHLGDTIRFFLDTKRAGGRGERTISEYRKKLGGHHDRPPFIVAKASANASAVILSQRLLASSEN
jgi:hypothetical protein